ncbi:MAG: hypothetical protein WBM38_11480 [Arenicellales bacterium]|jgi:plasmid maintenance system antidote protein VapI
MSTRHFVLLAFLFSNPAALAGEPEIEAKAAIVASPAKGQLSEKMQALLETITTPDMALQESRQYQQNGQFGLAKVVLQHGIELARSSGTEYVELNDELEYAMPVLQAKEHLVLGEPDQAEKILNGLADKFSNDQRRINEITALIGALSQSRLRASAKLDNERDVTRDVRHRLSQYYDEYGVFPEYAVLNEILPPGAELLQNYEIVYYKSVPNAYRLVLRNINNPKNLLKIEATGLIK